MRINNFTEGFGDEESEGWPIDITQVEVALELIKCVYLDIGIFIIVVFVDSPGYKVFDFV